MGELANCPECGNIFVKQVRNVCPDCYKEEEKNFHTVYDFLKKRENRQATIALITEKTGVDEDLIHKFVKEKRLRPSQFPNMSYPCEKCGTAIKEGRLCNNCATELRNDMEIQEEINAVGERNKKEKQGKSAYYSSRGE